MLRMTMKRLGHISQTLDMHEPQRTRQATKELAGNEKAQRIYELWREDMNMPTVKQIVQKVREKQK